MGEEPTRETSSEVELWGELGLVPKLGVKLRLARKTRFDRAIAAAAQAAEIQVDELQERLVTADDRVRDVLVGTATRAQEVDDDLYLDVLGRLIAGALDAANIDEIAYLTAEVVRLEPLHLRALFEFFHYGTTFDEKGDPSLSPAEADWAVARGVAADVIAERLKIGSETAVQVVRRLDRDGFLREVATGAVRISDNPRYVPSGWAAKTLGVLFPGMEVDGKAAEEASAAPVPEVTPKEVIAKQVEMIDGPDPSDQQRAITELEAEIKKLEREYYSSPTGLAILGDLTRYVVVLKRRLRRLDPHSPWAYED